MKKIAQEVYEQNQAKNQNTAFKVQRHIHNGVDSPRLNQDLIDNGSVYTTTMLSSVASETFTIEVVNGINNIVLYGIAFDTSASPSTKKAVLNGGAQLGNCYSYATTNGVSVSLLKTVGATSATYTQNSTSIYIDTSALTNTKVNATGGADANAYLIYVNDGTNIMASAQIIDWKNNSITIRVTLAANWKIQYWLTMS